MSITAGARRGERDAVHLRYSRADSANRQRREEHRRRPRGDRFSGEAGRANGRAPRPGPRPVPGSPALPRRHRDRRWPYPARSSRSVPSRPVTSVCNTTLSATSPQARDGDEVVEHAVPADGCAVVQLGMRVEPDAGGRESVGEDQAMVRHRYVVCQGCARMHDGVAAGHSSVRVRAAPAAPPGRLPRIRTTAPVISSGWRRRVGHRPVTRTRRPRRTSSLAVLSSAKSTSRVSFVQHAAPMTCKPAADLLPRVMP
jgi:hypothetical protein